MPGALDPNASPFVPTCASYRASAGYRTTPDDGRRDDGCPLDGLLAGLARHLDFDAARAVQRRALLAFGATAANHGCDKAGVPWVTGFSARLCELTEGGAAAVRSAPVVVRLEKRPDGYGRHPPYLHPAICRLLSSLLPSEGGAVEKAVACVLAEHNPRIPRSLIEVSIAENGALSARASMFGATRRFTWTELYRAALGVALRCNPACARHPDPVWAAYRDAWIAPSKNSSSSASSASEKGPRPRGSQASAS